MSNPANTAQIGHGVLAVLRRVKNIKKASDEERSALLEDAEALEYQSALLVLSAIVLEVVTWVSPLDPPFFKAGNALSDAFVAMGILGEMHFGQVVASIMKLLLAEAIERAAKADLARVQLEERLAPRSLTKEQFEKIQTLRGQIRSVIVAHDVDWEPSLFAHILAIALQKADISVGIVARGPHARSTANFLCDNRAFANSDGQPTNGEPLRSVLNEARIPISGVSARRPEDLPDSDPDTPMIVIGSRMAVVGTEPYVGEGSPPPPMTMLERMRNP